MAIFLFLSFVLHLLADDLYRGRKRAREREREVYLINCSWKSKEIFILNYHFSEQRVSNMVFCLHCVVFGFHFSENYFVDLQIFYVSVYLIPLQSIFLKLKWTHLWPIRVPSNWLFFLAQQDVPSSPSTLAHSHPESVIFLKSPDFFQWDWYLETKSGCQG